MDQPGPDPPRPLPAEIVLPTERTFRAYFRDPFVFNVHISSVVNSARGLAVDRWRLAGEVPAAPHSARAFPPATVATPARTVVRESPDLVPIDWASFPILVDGTEVVVDFADWAGARDSAGGHPHWLRFHFHSSDKAYPGLGSFPMANFMDWAEYDRLQQAVREGRNPASARLVLNNQDPGVKYDSRHRRRLLVRGMLDFHFGDRVDFARTGPADWHTKVFRALCYVQVPGSWENSLDRGQLEMIGLGIPTISPVMVDQCCDGLLQPGIHYLACRQDYKDVPDLVRWLDTHRGEAAAMGHNAWLFFQEFCTPLAVWSYVKDRIDHGARHARGTIDDDLCPPGLYDPRVPQEPRP